MSSRWVRTFIVAAGLAGAAITLSALDSDPAQAADRPPLPAIVDRAERTADRALTRPDREYPPRVLPRHRPPECEEPAHRTPPRKVRPAEPPGEPDRGDTSAPVEPSEPVERPDPEPDDQAAPVERPAPPVEPEPAPSAPPATPEPARPREPILDLPPVDVPPIVVEVPGVPVPPVVVDLPPLLPVTSPAAPAPVEPAPAEPTPVEPVPAEPAPIDTPPALPTTPSPTTPAPAAPVVELDPADVASPRAGPSGRPRPGGDSHDQADTPAVDPCERKIVRQGPHALPAPAAPKATSQPGKCPGEGPGTWVDGIQPVTLNPPAVALDLPCLDATVVVSDGALDRILVARARAHLNGRPVAALDPRPA